VVRPDERLSVRKRWPREHVDALPLSAEDKHVLVEVGLPEVLLLRFEERIESAREGRWLLGSDDDAPLWLERGAAVISGHGRYMNASVVGLATCLDQYVRYGAEVSALADEDPTIASLIDDVEREMRRADPTAFTELDHYWPVIVEQMRDGLL
jgi:hypothetical protein